MSWLGITFLIRQLFGSQTRQYLQRVRVSKSIAPTLPELPACLSIVHCKFQGAISKCTPPCHPVYPPPLLALTEKCAKFHLEQSLLGSQLTRRKWEWRARASGAALPPLPFPFRLAALPSAAGLLHHAAPRVSRSFVKISLIAAVKPTANSLVVHCRLEKAKLREFGIIAAGQK